MDDTARATGDVVWFGYQRAEHVAPTANDYTEAARIAAWVDTLDRDDYAANRQTGEYELTYTSNLARYYDTALAHGVRARDVAMLASAVSAFARELARRQQDAQWTDGWFPGQVGDAVVIEVTVRRVLSFAIACADSEGHQILVRKHRFQDDTAIITGDTVRVSGSIGGLNTYRGTKQTFISRPTVYKTTDELSATIAKKARAMFERLGLEVPEWAQVKAKTRSRKK
jgi:hypothetical protein